MADLLGPQPIPLTVVTGLGKGAAAGDPLLDILGGFFKATLNARAADLWKALAPNASISTGSECVRDVFTHDPEPAGQSFVDRVTPALFLWREQFDAAVWMAQGWRVRPSRIQLAWVFPGVPQERQSERAAFISALAGVLDQSLEFKGRDPAWIYPGDTDPDASTLGSSLWRFARLFKIEVGTTQPKPLIIRGPIGSPGVAPKSYFRIATTLNVWERIEQDPAAWYDLEDGLDAAINANGIDLLDPLFYVTPTVTSVTPTTGSASTALTIAGEGFRSGATVDVGGADATSVVVVSTTQITCDAPAHANGAVDVTVTNPDGGANALADAFTYA